MDPEIKKKIELNRQEALRRQALKRQNEEKQNLQEPANKFRKINPPLAPLQNANNNNRSSDGKVQKTVSGFFRSNDNNNNNPPVTTSNNQTNKPAPPKNIKISFALISTTRFNAKMDRYDEKVIGEFRKITSKNFDYQRKLWSFAILDYNQLIKSLEALKNVTIDQMPSFTLRLMRRETPSVNEDCLQKIEPNLQSSLLPFQKKGVMFGISRGGRVMIADDCGLGKTRQALGIVSFFQDFPVLVVTNASTREFWQSEILKMFDINERSVHILSKEYTNEQAPFLICSYTSLEQRFEVLKDRKFNTIIFDESHHIKNPKAKQTQRAEKLSQSAKRIIMLSGTPALSRPSELFTQLNILDPNFATFNQFAVRYCNGHYNHFGFDSNGSSNLEELKILLGHTLMIRRVKADVYNELHPKKRECVILENFIIPQNAKGDMDEFKQQYDNDVKHKDKILINWFTRTAELKLQAACVYLEHLMLTTKGKVLIFAHHAIMMNALSAQLEKMEIRHVYIDGTVAGHLRSERIELFQTNPNIRAAVLSTLATNAGITLTAASTICFFELEFNPSHIIQAEARAHRIGQKEEVKVYFLIAPSTADDVMWKTLVKKQDDLGKCGLVDNIEYLADNMQTSKFNPKKYLEKPPTDSDHGQNNMQLMNKEELEELAKIERDLLTYMTDFDDEDDKAQGKEIKSSTQTLEEEFLAQI